MQIKTEISPSFLFVVASINVCIDRGNMDGGAEEDKNVMLLHLRSEPLYHGCPTMPPPYVDIKTASRAAVAASFTAVLFLPQPMQFVTFVLGTKQCPSQWPCSQVPWISSRPYKKSYFLSYIYIYIIVMSCYFINMLNQIYWICLSIPLWTNFLFQPWVYFVLTMMTH